MMDILEKDHNSLFAYDFYSNDAEQINKLMEKNVYIKEAFKSAEDIKNMLKDLQDYFTASSR